MIDHSKHTNVKAAAGFTMIEVLVAVLVISIALLGLASLQAQGLNNNYSAYNRTQAALLAGDMADRIRANPTEAANPTGQYNFVSGPTTDPGCLAAPCNVTEIAQHDIFVWYDALNNNLNGTGNIVRNGSVYTVTVMWDDRKTGAAGTNCNPNDPNDMICYSIAFIP